MEVMHYSEYSQSIKQGDTEVTVIVQVPKDPEYPVHIIQQAGSKMLRFTLTEFEAIAQFVYEALKEAGWEETKRER